MKQRTQNKNSRVKASKGLKQEPLSAYNSVVQNYWKPFSALFLIAAVTIVTYRLCLFNGFVNYDDPLYITENPAIREFSFYGMMSFFHGNVGQYPPLVMMLISVFYHFFKLDPLPYHAVSLTLHIINSLLVFVFVFRFERKVLAAFIAGLLFGIHPLHVESVAWASELKDVLYAFFFLLGIIAYQKYTETNLKVKYLLFSAFCFLLSCFSKGMAVVFPVVLLLIDFYISGKICRKQLLEKIPFFVVALCWGIITYLTQQSMGATSGSDAVSWVQRIFIASYGLLFYLQKMVIPDNLNVFYAFPVKSGGWLPLAYYIAPLIVAIIGAAVFFSGSYRKILSFGLLFYFANLLLVLQLIPIGMAVTADRYFYLSSVGIFLIIGVIADRMIGIKPKMKGSLLSAIVLVTAVLCVHTHNQVSVWENSVTLWNQVVKNAGSFPGYALAFTSRGDARSDQQDFVGALEDYNTAIRLNPEYIDAYNNRGLIRGMNRDYQGAKEDFDFTLKLHPDYVKAYNNRGNANRFLGDQVAALRDFDQAILLKPDYWDAYINRGIIKYLKEDKDAACSDWLKVQQSGSHSADQLLLDYCRN